MPLPEQSSRGVKRRRVKGPEDDIEARLRRKLHHSLRELCKVVKKAKTFEVQKTVKKLKDARRKNPECDATKDLESQIEILKHINHDQIARSALLTKLKKDKTLNADALIQTISVELGSSIVSPAGSLVAKVYSRILSSKVLASEVMSTVDSLRILLHPLKVTDNSRVSPSKTSHEKDNESKGDDDEAVADDGWESGTVGAPSVSGSDDLATGSRDGDDTSSYGKPERKKPRIHGQSEFLPSLSVGFTRGDSGSEFSDSETKLTDGVKKNRRGQRARRAIWEKKFGKNANHVRKQRQNMKAGSKRYVTGSAPADNGDRGSGKGNSSLRRSRECGAPDHGHEPAYGARRLEFRRKQGEELHPSWEAKRKQKAASIVPSQGTKIVFSET